MFAKLTPMLKPKLASLDMCLVTKDGHVRLVSNQQKLTGFPLRVKMILPERVLVYDMLPIVEFIDPTELSIRMYEEV